MFPDVLHHFAERLHKEVLTQLGWNLRRVWQWEWVTIHRAVVEQIVAQVGRLANTPQAFPAVDSSPRPAGAAPGPRGSGSDVPFPGIQGG